MLMFARALVAHLQSGRTVRPSVIRARALCHTRLNEGDLEGVGRVLAYRDRARLLWGHMYL